MNKNIKLLFLLTTVLMILLTISAIDATEVNDDAIIDDAQVGSQDIISESVSDTISDTDDNKEITKKDNNNVFTKGDDTTGDDDTLTDTNLYMYTRSGDTINSTIKVSGKLQSNGAGVTGEPITINVNNNTYHATSGGSGYFTVNHTITTYDDLNVTFTYAGSSTYKATTNSTVYKVVKPTTLYIYPRSGDLKDTTIKVSGKLLDIFGEGVKGEKINITVNDAVYSATSGGYGYFTVNHTITSYDDLNITFTYAGGKNYEASTNSTIYTVKKPSSLYIYPRSNDIKGTTIKVSGKLLDTEGEGIKGEKINITVNDAVYSATSGGYGYFTVNHTITSYDDLNVTFTYAGGKKYEASTNSTIYTVKGPETITDETYSYFFNEDGTIIEGSILEGTEAVFEGTLTNKKFIITLPITITTGETQAVFDGCTFTINSPVTIENVKFTGGESSTVITAASNVTFENVTFDAVKATGAYMIDPAIRANITFINCTVNDFEGNAIVRSSAKRTGISITVVDSVFKDNDAAFSVFCEFGNGWKINLTNSNFTNNKGQNGAVVQGMSTGTTLNLNVDNCNFEGNIASGKAGVIYSASNNAVITIVNSNFTGNEVQSSSSGSSPTNLASVLTVGNGNTNVTLCNNVMSGSTAENGTDVYFELSSAGTGKIYTDAKLIAENATTDKDQFVDLKFKLTDDMGNLIGFKAGNIFNYSVTLNDEEISYIDSILYGRQYGFYGVANKTLNATYPGGLYPITLAITAGADKFDSIEIINGELEVIAPDTRIETSITYDVINDVEGKVAIEFTLLDEENNEISNEQLVFTGDITGTINSGKVYKNAELTEGEYIFNVKFEGTEDYKDSDINITLNVQKDPQKIIDELNESLINNETALNNTIESIEQLQAENEALKEQKQNLEDALQANATALANNITALEEANEQITQLEQNITTLNEQLEANKTALEGNMTALAEAQSDIESLNGEISELEAALEANETALAGANAQIDELNAEIDGLEAALEANKTALEQAQSEIESLNGEISDLEDALEANETALADANAQIDELNANIDELEAALEANKTALAEAQGENAELTAQIEELEAALEANKTALEEAQAEIESLNDEISDLESALEANETALADAREEIESLNGEISDLEDALDDKQEELDEANAQIDDLNNQIDDLESELEQTKTELEDAQTALNETEAQIESLNEQITGLEDALADAQSELADTQEALDEANNEIDELKYKVSELELALNMTEQALDKVIEALQEQNKPKTTNISIDTINNAKYGDEITISGLLVNEDAIGLSNEVVTITFNGEEIEVTTRNGEFTYTTTATQIGENTITASYAGSDKYLESDADYAFEVAKADTTITIEDIDPVKKGETVTITGTLTDHNNNTLANKVVRLLINNGRKTLKTDENGVYTFDYTLTRIGENTITATFEEDDYYTKTTTTITVETAPLKTEVVLDTLNPVVKGTKATFTGTVLDENGEAVANAQVKLTINGNTKTLKTDSEGRFTHTFTMNTLGNITVSASYAGSASYDGSDDEITVEVVKAKAIITLDDMDSITKGDTATFSGTLTDADGKAIANAQVKLTINGSQKTLKTDENGVFTHTFKMIKEGTNNIAAIFNGNNDYAAANTNSTVEVVKA